MVGCVCADLKRFAPKLEVKEDKIKDWPADSLVVFAEHPSYFYDMMSKPMLAQVDTLANEHLARVAMRPKKRWRIARMAPKMCLVSLSRCLVE